MSVFEEGAEISQTPAEEWQEVFNQSGLKLTSQIMRELLSPGPGALMDVEAALYFTSGQLIFHHRASKGSEKIGGEHFKCVSPQQVANAFATQTLDTGWLPPGVVRWGKNKKGQDWLVKLIPAAVHVLTLTRLKLADRKLAGDEDTRTIRVPLPPLVFGGSGNRYFVWALNGLEGSLAPDGSLDGNAPLYTAPLPNVYDNTSICFGQNNPPAASWDTIERVWRLFISDAPYNADLSRNKSQTHPEDVRAQLLALADQYEASQTGKDAKTTRNRKRNLHATSEGKLEYPLADLVQIINHYGQNLTLNDAVRRCLIGE
jgi:hypothetical protein